MTKKVEETKQTIDAKKIASQLRTMILEAKDLPVKEVIIPEWGNVKLYLRAMTARQRDDWGAQQFVETDDGKKVLSVRDLSASLLVHQLCADPEGKELVFTVDDIPALSEKSAVVINRLQDALREVSGVTEKDQEELLKNLKGQDEVSG